MSGSPIAASSVSLAESGSSSRLLLRWFELGQHLSLDIVAGVGCAAAFAVTITGATMPLSWWILLPLATWVIYSADHLLDARHTGPGAQQPRHRFYHRQFVALAALTLPLVMVGGLLGILWLPRSLLVPGLAVGVAAVIHLALARRKNRVVSKELSVASIYVGGIWFGPLTLAPELSGSTFAFVGLHLIAAFLNLIAFAVFEERQDKLDGHASIVRSWGRRRVENLLALLTVAGVAGVLVTAALVPAPRPVASLVLLALILIPLFLLRQHEAFAAGQRYRMVGDLAFLLLLVPALIAS